MKKTIIIASALFVITIQAFAQKEFKLAKSSGKLVINNISNLTVEGYDGKEIIITSTSNKEEKSDPRAEGLTALGSSGFDNTGLGVSITEKNQIAEMTAIDKPESLKVKVRLPYTLALSIVTNTSYIDSTTIKLSNLKSEVDASLRYENIKLTNIVGPLSIKTLEGNIEATLDPSFKGPISLISRQGFVDVKVPSTAKADLSINTTYETLYASKDLKLELTETKTKEASSYSSAIASTSEKGSVISVTTPIVVNGSESKTSVGSLSSLGSITPTYTYNFGSNKGTSINGTLNGGGEKIVLKSTYGKIYLRK